MQQTACEGIIGFGVQNGSVDEERAIQTEFDPEIVLAIENGIALLAVVSK